MEEPDLIHDWNEAGERWEKPAHEVGLVDETLRDGLQGNDVRSPALAEKIEILHLMDRLGIGAVSLGLPGAGPAAAREVARLAAEIREAGLAIRACCAARALVSDVTAILEISQSAGLPIEVHAFVGSSPIRRFAEDWPLDRVRRHSEQVVAHAVRHGLAVVYVTEDTARSAPDTLRALFRAALDGGAARLCLSDTAGHATPAGAANLVRFAREVVRASGTAAGLDWHGHSDRGLGVANALGAIRAGAGRVHACALGLGERTGNTPMDQLLVNLRLLGWIGNDLGALAEYCRRVSEATGVAIPPAYPAVGRDAFRSATGAHASALLKATRLGRPDLADLVLSGVPAGLVGRRPEIEIGPLSGAGHAAWWLVSRGIEPTPERTRALCQRARSEDRVLSDDEVRDVLDSLDETRTS